MLLNCYQLWIGNKQPGANILFIILSLELKLNALFTSLKTPASLEICFLTWQLTMSFMVVTDMFNNTETFFQEDNVSKR